MGGRVIVNHGVTVQMTKMVPITDPKVPRYILTVPESCWSSVYVSFEKRFKILPNGVVSKKLIGALMMVFKSLM